MTSQTDTQIELEAALLEQAMFAGTPRGDVAGGRASLLIQRLEAERRQRRGDIPCCPKRQAAWEAYLGRVVE